MNRPHNRLRTGDTPTNRRHVPSRIAPPAVLPPEGAAGGALSHVGRRLTVEQGVHDRDMAAPGGDRTKAGGCRA